MLTELQAESHGRIRVTELRDPDKLALNTALADCQPHIVHFIGHGRYRERAGALAFVKKTARGPQATWLSDTAFADCFRDVTAPRLIFLHACEGARSESYEAFSGVSLQLVYSRMPAVIAMRCPIPNHVAIAFARSLYGALSEGAAIDEAVQAGRRKLGIYLDDDENFDPPRVRQPGRVPPEQECGIAQGHRHPRGRGDHVEGRNPGAALPVSRTWRAGR